MGYQTGIEWCTATWNPWRGCDKVSPGCANCYMFSEQKRYGRDPAKVVRSKTTFSDPIRWKDPQTVFTCSWSDFFHRDADAWRDGAWRIIRDTPWHRYLILTKRIEDVADRLPWPKGAPWPNVWLGTSIENRRFSYRADRLLDLCAAGRFVSAEPLLEEIDIRHTLGKGGIEWVIAGGESGVGARPFNIEWARSLRDQCSNRAAFFFKQAGRRPFLAARRVAGVDYTTGAGSRIRMAAVEVEVDDLGYRDHKGGDPAEWPADLRVRELPWAGPQPFDPGGLELYPYSDRYLHT